MPLVQVPGYVWIPGHMPDLVATGFTFLTLDGTNLKRGNVFIIPRSGTLETFEFHTNTVTTGNDLKISFQDVNVTTGFPDEVIDEYRIVSGYAANSWITPGKMTSDGTDLGTPRSVTVGDIIAVVIEWAGAAGSMQLKVHSGLPNLGIPYGVAKAASWTKHNNPIVGALKYSDGYVYISFAGFPINLGTSLVFPTVNFKSDSSPDEHGIRFKVPFKCKLNGFVWYCGPAGVAAEVTLKLYDSSDTVLWSKVLDADQFRGNAEGFLNMMFSPIDIFANTLYRLSVVANNTLANFTVRYFESPTNSHLDAFPGGKEFYGTTRTDAGAWTDINTRRYFVGLLISDIDNGAGGGGGGETSHVF